jgi:hypothetical protein
VTTTQSSVSTRSATYENAFGESTSSSLFMSNMPLPVCTLRAQQRVELWV